MASSCGVGKSETSTADLRRTSIKFSSTILPYYIRGHIPQGGAELSSNNQVLTVKSIGNCGDTYFVYFKDGYEVRNKDNKIIEMNTYDNITAKWALLNPCDNGQRHM